MKSPAALLDTGRRRLLAHRWLLAALCLATAATLGFRALTGPPPPTTPVWTARYDVPSGTVLRASDFRQTSFTPGSVPAGALRDLDRVLGRTLVTPLERGEAVSVRKLLGPGRLTGYPGRAAVAVRVPDADLSTLLRPGDHVDLLRADPRGAQPTSRVARDAVVLTVVDPGADGALSGGGAEGRLVVFAALQDQVEGLAAATSTGFLTAVWNR